MKKVRLAGISPVWKIGGMALSLLMLLGLGACGDKKAEISVTPMTTSITGPAGEMFQVVDKSRTLKVDGNKFTVNVGLKRTAEGSVEDMEWGIELLDENDEVVASDEDVFAPEGKDTLDGLKVGDDGSLRLSVYEHMDDSDIKKISKFRITSKAKKVWGSSSSSEEVVAEEVVAEESVSASSGSEDWDKILDEYEKFVDKSITYAKKAQAGDVSAMTEYASLLESAESLQKKLENAGSNLSAAQAARLNKIAAKMANAMM